MKILKIITIPGQLISKKNNMMAIRFGGHASINHKKPWKEYEKQALEFLKKIEPIKSDVWPIYMHVYHYRRTKAAFDYNNLVQGVCDVLQGDFRIKTKDFRHQIIPEDDMKHLIPILEGPYAGWEVCKEMPRTVITFTTDPYYLESKDLTKQGVMKMLEEYSETGQ